MLLLILAQAATVVAPPPQRIDILAPRCAQPTGDDVVVCGQRETARLPLPGERGPPDHPVPGNPDVSGTGALAMSVNPCATLQGGCQAGVNIFGLATAAARLVGKIVDPNSCCDEPGQATNHGALIRDAAGALRKKPDKSNRVAIDLNAPPPPIAGRLSR